MLGEDLGISSRRLVCINVNRYLASLGVKLTFISLVIPAFSCKDLLEEISFSMYFRYCQF